MQAYNNATPAIVKKQGGKRPARPLGPPDGYDKLVAVWFSALPPDLAWLWSKRVSRRALPSASMTAHAP